MLNSGEDNFICKTNQFEIDYDFILFLTPVLTFFILLLLLLLQSTKSKEYN